MSGKIYIRGAAAVSPQHTSGERDGLINPVYYAGNRLHAIEPDYARLIDGKLLRRMSRIIKMGVATASLCLQDAKVDNPDAICTGTAWGCIQDTDVFLTDITQRNEDAPPPTAFIQSTHNVVGAQVALMLKNHGYNNTFVYGGLSFESALLDAMLLLKEEEAQTVLTGSIEEITDTSYALLERFGVLKQSNDSTATLFQSNTRGTVIGEGAAFFMLSSDKASDKAESGVELKGLHTFHQQGNADVIAAQVRGFLETHAFGVDDIDLVIAGRNGDVVNDDIYDAVGQSIFANTKTASYKHLCGEYPTSSSFALWMAYQLLHSEGVPSLFDLQPDKKIQTILIYNHYKNKQHSLMLLTTT